MIKTTAIMKRYKLTLIPGDKVFDSLFETEHDASTFALQYMANNPGSGLTMFDFRLDECDIAPTDISSYDDAISSLGGLKYVTISVDVKNREKLSELDTLMTIARAWNKVDGTPESLPHPDTMRYFPQFSYGKDDDQNYFCHEHPMVSENDFGIDALLSFRTKELAEDFSAKFKAIFAELFNIPYEP